jgi:hypothetical protein
MNISDLIVIYLAFGAPFAVYKYLQTRSTSRGRKILISVVTLMFWIPTAVRLAYRHFSNAYYKPAFVSKEFSDAHYFRLDELRETLRTGFVSSRSSLGMHNIREVIERYSGLSQLVMDEPASVDNSYAPLFDAAGRSNSVNGSGCLIRRNRSRIRRHHTQAREHFLSLFRQMSRHDGQGLLRHGIELARHLDDPETMDQLGRLIESRSTLWNPEQKQDLAPPNYSTAGTSLQMTAKPLKGD